jgi:decaprenylphospho-beta-D-ribofuranose 2-oxidase
MPQAEAVDTVPPTLEAVPTTLSGWGGATGVRAQLLRAADVDSIRVALERARRDPATSRGVLARGLGRSYGDAAQRDGGIVIDVTPMSGFRLDNEHGTVTAQAGTSISELLTALVPAGWIVPVVPGTQHVTVGGAIASDIHGKNHRAVGTFGNHVEALGLLTANGELLELEHGTGDGLLEATIGGMGLTGVIVWARIRLRAVTGGSLSVDTDRVADIDEALAILASPGGSHRVAWLDLLSARPGRGIVTRAEHLADDQTGTVASRSPTVAARATVPSRWPSGLLRPGIVRAYNELRFRQAPRRQRGRLEAFGAHMFPLDALEAWPRLYGPRGFLQYQLVVPYGQEQALHAIFERLQSSGVPCYLAVLKDFGDANDAPLSFPLAGWTLALDFPLAAAGLEALLRRFDELVAEAGGRVYLSKDARLRADVIAAMYPRLSEWREVRDRHDPDCVWRSDLALRTELVRPSA